MISDKILFLDIDGVLNSNRTFYAGMGCGFVSQPSFSKTLDPVAISMLKKLQSKGVTFVLSSTWRIGIDSKDDLERFSKELGLNIHSITPNLLDKNRGYEIDAWFTLQDVEPSKVKYVILDDDEDFHDYQFSHLVHVDPEEGYSFKDFKKTLDILHLNLLTL